MHAELTTRNGTEVFTDSGIWLHHIIFFNHGIKDLVCLDIAGDRFFGGGNERDTWRSNTIGRWGYQVKENHRWDIAIEFRNDNDKEVDLNMVVRYGVVSGENAERHGNVAAIWLDMTGCGNAEMEVKSLNEPFGYRSLNRTSSTSSIIVNARGHMHNGGVRVTAYRNNKAICVSGQPYNNQAAVQHIIGGRVCKDIGRVNKGDVLWADAKYDPRLHSLVLHGDKPDAVMGAMGVFIGLD